MKPTSQHITTERTVPRETMRYDSELHIRAGAAAVRRLSRQYEATSNQ